jgi:hypothetical protein
VRENANRKLNARRRIKDALDSLRKLGRSFTTVELQQAAGCSRQTLYNHADIWRSDYEDLAAGFFAICTDEYNAVEGAGGRETLPPPSPVNKNMPPGLLAARRVAYEISMRTQREKRQIEKACRSAQDASEKHWQANVLKVTEKEPSELSIPELKTTLNVLLAYLRTAPTEESQFYIQNRIIDIRNCLAQAGDSPLRIVRPP